MSVVADLIDQILQHPLVGGLAAAWVAAVSTLIYIVKRMDDNKQVSSATKAGLAGSLAVAIILTAIRFLPPSRVAAQHIEPSPAPTAQASGHRLLKISDDDWKCERFDTMVFKYGLTDKVHNIEALADKGDHELQYVAGMLNSSTMSMETTDKPNHRIKYLTAGAQAKEPRSMLALALVYSQNGDTSSGIALADAAEATGFPFASLFLGNLYDGSGPAPVKADAHRAARYYQDALEKGCVGLASQKLAYMYLGRDIGTTRGEPTAYLDYDRARGIYLLEQAAKTPYGDRYLAVGTILDLLLKSGNTSESGAYVEIARSICPDLCAREIADYYYLSKQGPEALEAYKRLAGAAKEFGHEREAQYAAERIAELRGKLGYSH